MAPTEPITQVSEPQRRDTGAVLRICVYVVAALMVCIVAWALIEGGERDLWTRTSAAVVVMASIAW